MRRLFVCAAVVFGLLCASVARAESDEPLVPSISVVGSGEVQVAPDQVTVTVGVTTEAKTAADALKANNESMTALFKTLRENNIADKHVQTSNFHVNPQQVYDQDRQHQPRIVGYMVTNQVTVKVVEVTRLGAILDAVVQAGSNQIQGVSFSVADPSPHLDQARRKAMADARHRAEVYAEAAGLKLGKAELIQEQSASGPRPVYAQAMRAAAAEVPIAAGEQTISAQISVTFGIEK